MYNLHCTFYAEQLRQTMVFIAYLTSLHSSTKQKKLEIVAKPSVMVALRCFTDAEFLWQHAKISLPSYRGRLMVSSLNDTITVPHP